MEHVREKLPKEGKILTQIKKKKSEQKLISYQKTFNMIYNYCMI